MSAPDLLSLDNWLGLLLRLGLALLVGALVGLEREASHKPAGLRTHMLVSLGAAFFVLVPIQLGSVQADLDPLSRVIQGVAAGIGFIGAGVILQDAQENGRVSVRGLTTAASTWVAAALGIAAGCGLWELGLIGALMVLLTLTLVKRLETWL